MLGYTPHPGCHCCGRYASYWNAFLVWIIYMIHEQYFFNKGTRCTKKHHNWLGISLTNVQWKTHCRNTMRLSIFNIILLFLLVQQKGSCRSQVRGWPEVVQGRSYCVEHPCSEATLHRFRQWIERASVLGSALRIQTPGPSRSGKKRECYRHLEWVCRSRPCTPCGNINKFGLLRGDQKIMTTFYNGGLWENIWKHK